MASGFARFMGWLVPIFMEEPTEELSRLFEETVEGAIERAIPKR